MRKSKNRNKSGFTLVEVMFSIGALAVASLGVLSVLTYGTMAGDSAGNFSEATQLGREIIENIRVDRYSFNPFAPPTGLVNATPTERVDLTAAPFNTATVSLPQNSRFKRNIQITEVEPDRLAKIQVKVFWEQQGREKFVETVAYARSGA